MGWDSNPRYAFDVNTLSREIEKGNDPDVRSGFPSTDRAYEHKGESVPSDNSTHRAVGFDGLYSVGLCRPRHFLLGLRWLL